MSIINVYDLNFKLLGVLDSFESLIWRPSFCEIGDFEIFTTATAENVSLLKENRLVVRDTDIGVDKDHNVTYKKVMIIKNLSIKTNVEDGNKLIVTGKELKFLLHQRIIWQQTNLKENVEHAIRRLVIENAQNPLDPNRKISNLTLGPLIGFSENIEKQLTGDFLDEAIVDICSTYGMGWNIFGYNGKFVFSLSKSTDRSYNQQNNPFIVFSEKFDNLFSSDYSLQSEKYCNTALVAGEGEGLARKTTTVNNQNSGINRYELFVDAKDLSQNENSSNPNDKIGLPQYINLLKERANEKLTENNIKECFSGEIIDESNSNFIYGIDFHLGDIVTVISSYNFVKNVKIVSAIESEDENGIKLIPQFNF